MRGRGEEDLQQHQVQDAVNETGSTCLTLVRLAAVQTLH